MRQAKHIDSNDALSEGEIKAAISETQDGNTIKSFDPSKKYKCTYPGCDNQFIRPSRLARHMRQHNGERPYKCTHSGCDKAYTNSSHLKRHMQTHNLFKMVCQCQHCFLMISNRHNLRRHYERVHNEKNKITCKECNAVFTKKHQLSQHMQTHEKTVYKCKTCDRSFRNSFMLKKHERTHVPKKKSYYCDHSHDLEVFKTWNDLCTHLRTQHVAEYNCAHCDKKFLYKSHLKTHLQIHTVDRPILACPYEKCTRQYYFKRNLIHHIRSVHEGVKFYCDICSIGVSTKQKLIQHIAALHDPARIKKKTKKLHRKKRKDAGKPKKSAISTLMGIAYQPDLDKALLQRDINFKLEFSSDKLLKDTLTEESSVA